MADPLLAELKRLDRSLRESWDSEKRLAAERDRLRVALERVIPMLDEAAGTYGTEAANPRYQAAQALLVIHGALRGSNG